MSRLVREFKEHLRPFRLFNIRTYLGLAEINGNTEALTQAAAHVAAIGRAVKALEELLMPAPTGVRFLQGAERTASLIGALEAGAKARGPGVYPIDSLHSLVVDHAAAEDQAFWDREPAGLIAGLLREDREVGRQLEARGVLVWEGHGTATRAGDELWRLVNTQWLEAHEEIRAFVTDLWPGGQRCRFCGAEEPLEHELQRVDLETRAGVAYINGKAAVSGASVSTHQACRPLWLKWLEIASSYSSQEAAAEADAAAGRSARAKVPTLPAIELERPVGEPPPREFPTGGDDE